MKHSVSLLIVLLLASLAGLHAAESDAPQQSNTVILLSSDMGVTGAGPVFYGLMKSGDIVTGAAPAWVALGSVSNFATPWVTLLRTSSNFQYR